jgi:uncharacterized protein (UPF0548 family)
LGRAPRGHDVPVVRATRAGEASALPAARSAELRRAALTYGEVGATAGDLPDGYHGIRRSAVVGAGASQFRSASVALMGWQVQLRAGVRVSASHSTVERDAVADLGLGVGPLRVTAPVRVVSVVDEPTRRGFAYGTLPGHPERGEERFVVSLEPTGLVLLTITAFSRPAWRLARLSGPGDDIVQALVTLRYLAALRPRG